MSPEDKFTVRYDPPTRLLSWTLRGFWTMADVQAFAVALGTVVDPPGLPPKGYDGLCDATDFPVQSAEVGAALGQLDRTGNASRKAIVVGSMMNKLQAERTLLSEGVRVFLSIDDAKAWLHLGSEE